MIQILKAEILQQMEELVASSAPPEVLQKYRKLDRLFRLYDQAEKDGWEKWSWGVASQQGWLSEQDYIIFADEIKANRMERADKIAKKLTEEGVPVSQWPLFI